MGQSQKFKDVFVPRITQLDANEFDKEINNVLLAQLMKISNYLKPGALNNVKLEMNLILDFIIFYYSIVIRNATFGQELLGLKYQQLLTKNQATVYAFLNYIVPYLKNKYDNYSSRVQNITIRNLVDKLEVFVKVCNFLNHLYFLREGKYPTIVDRCLKLRHSPISKLNHTGSYNYMTRELLWHGFMELLMYTLPLVNYRAIKRKFKKRFLFQSSQTRSEKSVIFTSDTKCVVCDDFPVLPCMISTYCPHLACYYCLKSNLLADEKYMCPVCGETNTANEEFKFFLG